MREDVLWSSCGGPIVGNIKHGKKYPFGTVTAAQYEQDLAQIRLTLAEAVARLQNKETSDIEAVTGSITQVNAKIELIKTDLTDINGILTELRSSIKTLDNKHEADKTALQGQINAFNSALALLTQTVNANNTAVNARLNSFESRITDNVTKTTELQATVTAMGGQISGIQSDVSNVKTRMTNYEVLQSSLRQQILNTAENMSTGFDAVNNNINVINNNISGIKADMSQNQADMTVLIGQLNQRITALEGSAPLEIISFTASPNICEKGGSENIVLTWNISGNPTSVRINGNPVSGNTVTMQNVSEPTAYVLTAVDEKGISVTKSLTITFINHILYGATTAATMTANVVKGLDHDEFSETVKRKITVTVNNEYIVYAYPKRLGTVQFEVAGFTGGFEAPATISVDNHSGFSEDYYVYRSSNILTGTYVVTVK